jgi:Tfp pilus assembly protein PilF
VREDANVPELDRFEPEGGNPADFAALIEATQQAREAVDRGEYQAAEELLRPVLDVLKDSPQAYEVQAMALMFQRRTGEAVPVPERALALAPDDTGLRGWYGSALNEVGRYHEAADQFRIVLRQNLQDPRTLHNMAISLIHLGRLGDADQHLEWAVAIEPRNPRL